MLQNDGDEPTTTLVTTDGPIIARSSATEQYIGQTVQDQDAEAVNAAGTEDALASPGLVSSGEVVERRAVAGFPIRIEVAAIPQRGPGTLVGGCSALRGSHDPTDADRACARDRHHKAAAGVEAHGDGSSAARRGRSICWSDGPLNWDTLPRTMRPPRSGPRPLWR
jgi:hypothetical protein